MQSWPNLAAHGRLSLYILLFISISDSGACAQIGHPMAIILEVVCTAGILAHMVRLYYIIIMALNEAPFKEMIAFERQSQYLSKSDMIFYIHLHLAEISRPYIMIIAKIINFMAFLHICLASNIYS